MIKTDSDFRCAYEMGLEWENLVAIALRGVNPGVLVPPKHSRVIGGRVVGFEDDGDMVTQVVIACKRRNLSFTSQSDFPYPTVKVEEEYKLIPEHLTKDEYYAMPVSERLSKLRWFHSYWIGSQDMSHVCLIIPASKKYWTLETHYSRPDRREVTSWACPVEKCVFAPTSHIPQLLVWT